MSKRKADLALTHRRFLEAAWRLFAEKGYDGTTVNDIISAVGLSKGAFYHHFSAKEDVLSAVVEKIVTEEMSLLSPIIQDPSLTALQALDRYFNAAREWEMSNLALLMEVGSAMFDDRNAIIRYRYHALMLERLTPVLADLFRRGIEERQLDIPDPVETAAILVDLFISVADRLFADFLAGGREAELYKTFVRRIDVLLQVLERLLGVPLETFTRLTPRDLEILRGICHQRARRDRANERI